MSIADDPTIPDDADLWRLIHPDWIVEDLNEGRQRISSQAFQNLEDDKLSVLLGPQVRASGRTDHDIVAAQPGYGVAAVTAGQARELDQGIIRAPEKDEPAHCHMVGKKTKSTRKKLARAARLIVGVVRQ